MSERECVMDYLYGRYHDAWDNGDDVEAQQCHRFYTILDEMTDTQYEDTYGDKVEA